MSGRKLEKAISVCDRKRATLDQIIEECGAILHVLICDSPAKASTAKSGLLSCSVSKAGLLVLCVWEKPPNGNDYERIKHIGLGLSEMSSLGGFLRMAMQLSLERRQP